MDRRFNQGLVPYAKSGTIPNQSWWIETRRGIYVVVTRTEEQLYLMVRDGRAESQFATELGVRAEEHCRWE